MIVKKGTYSFVAEAAGYGINSSANIEIGSATATAEFKSGTYKFNQTKIGTASGQTGTLKVSGGTFTSSDYFAVGQAGTGYLEIDGGTVKATGNYMRIGAGGNGVVAIKSGSFDNSSAANNNLTLGQNASCSGTLNVEGGTFTVGGQIFLNYSESAVKSTINITGGMLTANKIALSNAGTDGGTITIDGGTLKANVDNTSFLPAFSSDPTKFRVYAGADGATIDTDNHAITIGAVIEDKSGEAGSVMFKGGGLVTLSGTPTYTGTTTIEDGTSLSLTAAAKDAIFAHDVIVEIPSTGVADGTTVFQITDGGTFTLSDVEAIMVTATDVYRYLLALAAGDTKIVIVDTQAVEYMWNGGSSGANWTVAGKWLCDGAAATWAEGNIAVFANEGDEATVDSDVTAASVAFRADATVAAGEGTLTASSVAVSDGVEAVINAATAGTLEKTGEGTLTLGASRTGQTTLTEGTLTMYGSGTTLDWSKFTFGTDAAKTVTLQFTDGATLAGLPQDINFPQTENMTATIVKDSGDWNVGNNNFTLCGAAGTTAVFIQNGGTLVCGNYFVIGNDSSATSTSMTINGGTVNCTKNLDDYIAIGSHCAGSLTVKGANSVFNATANSLSVGRNAAGTLTVEDGGTVSVATDICLSRNSGGAGSSVTLKSGGTIVAERVYSNYAGAFVFDGGILKARTTGKTLLDGSSNLVVSVTSNGGTVDADGKTVTIDAAISGDGAMTFKGGGKVTLSGTPSYTGGTTIQGGTSLSLTAAAKDAIFAHDVTVEIPSTGVAHGATVFQITDSGMFTQSDVEAIAVTGTDAGRYRLGLAFNDTEVIVIDTQAAEYVWNGGSSGANWTVAGKWLCDGESATWVNDNIAVFANEGDEATVDSDVTAASVAFRADATVAAGEGTLAVPWVAVENGVEAVINAPTTNTLEKTGAGTLTLGASRTEQTLLTEGTLVMTGDGTTLDWSKVTLGTDARRPVTLVVGADVTPTFPSPWNVVNVEGVSATIRKTGGDWTTAGNMSIGCAASAAAAFYNESGTLAISRYMNIGSHTGATSSLLEISGGMVTNTTCYIIIGTSSPGTMTVRTGGKYGVVHSGWGLIVGGSFAGTLNVAGGDVFVGGPLTLSYNGGNSTVNVTDGGVLTFNEVTVNMVKTGGEAVIMLDGGTIRANADSTSFIPAKDNMTVVVKSGGGTIDTNGKTIAIAQPLLADAESTGGGMTFKGGGKVTLSGTPTYTGGTTVEGGTSLSLTAAAKDAIFAHDVTVEIPSTDVAHGATAFKITDSGTFTQSDVEAIAVTGTDAGRYRLGLAFNDTEVIVIDTQAAEYVWNGGSSGANWTVAGKWLCDGESATWVNDNIAVFENEGDGVTVDSDVTAASVAFRADATVAAGEGMLAVPWVAVENGVEAVINAPTTNALEKTGAGTLTLGASRTEQTLLTEGTLVMSGSGTTLDWTKLTFGTDARKPVTLQFTDGATLAGLPQAIRFPTTADRSATIVKDSGDWNVGNNNFTLCNAAGTTAGFIQNGGTLTCGNYFVIGNDSSATSASMTINGGTVNCTKNLDDYIAIGSHCAGSLTVKGANSVFNATVNSLSVGRNAAGTLTVEDGGTVSVATDICLSRNSGGVGSSVTLKSGGTIVAERVCSNYAGTFVFDGGILKARTTGKTLIDGSNNLAVSVTSNGGTVDADGKTVTIDAAISGDGAMTFKGGGKVTLAAGNTYTGTTTVEVGTAVHIPSASALAGKVDFSIPATLPEEGVYSSIVIDGEGTFPSAILDNVEKPTGVTALRLSGDGKSVLCIYGNPANTWTGGASGSLGDWANWSLGYVPYRDSCVIGYATAATLTNPAGSWFEPSSITFPADSAAVTIVGEGAISNINEIKNLSPSVNHVFNVPVSGPENAAVVMNTQTYCVFSGGMTAHDVDFSQAPETDNARTFAGNWTLTKTDDWTPQKNETVANGASLYVKNYSNTANDTLLIQAGGVVTAEVAKVTGSSDGFLTRGINGTMVVTGECKMDSTGVNRFVAQETSTGTIIANKFSSTSTSIKYLLKNDNGFRHVVGAGGIAGTGWKGYANWNSVIACTNDFEITGTIEGYTSGTKNTYTLVTTGGYRVSLVSGGKLTGEKTALNVAGDGTFALAGGTADFQKGLTVNDGATVAVNAGCTPGNGEVMVKEGATFEVSGGGSVPLGGNLKLMDGATLRFNFTSRKNPPVMKMNGNPAWFGSTKNVTVTF